MAWADQRVSRTEDSRRGHIHLDKDPDLDQAYHFDVDSNSDISLYQTNRNIE